MNARIPRTVLLSVSLLITMHAIGLWRMVLFSNALGIALWMPYGLLAIVYSVLVVLFVQMLRGKRWARDAYTCLAALGFLSALGHASAISALGVVDACAKGVAIVLLYRSAGKRWFSRGNASTPASVPAD